MADNNALTKATSADCSIKENIAKQDNRIPNERTQFVKLNKNMMK